MKAGILVVMFISFFSQFILSQEEEVAVEDIFKLVQEGKVITSTRTERLLKTAPHAVTVITRKQIEESGATTLSEALRGVPGVNARMTPMGSQIGIRSFGSTPFSERVLFLIDGTPYNSPDKGGYPGHPAYEDFFPLEAVKRIEVIKGPGSALYGQNAFFGIINIITDDFQGSNNAVVTGGSRDTAAAFVRGGGDGDWKYTYLGKYKQQNGPMKFLQVSDAAAGQTTFPVPGVQNGKTDVKSGDVYFKAGHQGLTFSYLFHKDETGSYNWFRPLLKRTDGTIIFDGKECCSTFPTEQTLQFIDASYTRKFSDNRNWRFKAFYNRRNGNTCENCHHNAAGPVLLSEDETNQRFFVNTQYDLDTGSHKVIFGADAQFDNTEKNIAKISDADPSIRTLAAYIQDEVDIVPDEVIATVGVRIDHNEITDSAVSPSASLVFLASDKLVLRTLYGRAFRQPTWNDLFIETEYAPASPNAFDFGPSLTSFLQQGNPLVDTERIDTFELGAEYLFDSSFSTKIDFFYSKIQDLIEAYDFRRTPPFSVCDPRPGNPLPLECSTSQFFAQTKNLSDRDLKTRGLEIEFRFKPSTAFSAIVGYALQKNDFNSPGPGVDAVSAYSPEHKVTALINLKPVDSVLFNLSLNYWSEYNSRTFFSGAVCGACTNTDPIGQSYTYANFKTLVKIPVGGQQLGLGFALKNLFDEELQLSHAFRVDAALFGREYFGSIEYDF